MRVPDAARLRDRLAIGNALDHLWGETMGLAESDPKRTALRLVTEILEREGVRYALIGGVAVQLHTEEPRTTLDIDLAVRRYADVPSAALASAGFEHTGRHEHSDNWRAPGSQPVRLRTAIQFSAEDVGIADAVERAELVQADDDLRFRLATVEDLIVLKLAAAGEPTRRLSKREHDLADVLALLEEHPDVMSPELEARLEDVRMRLAASSPRTPPNPKG